MVTVAYGCFNTNDEKNREEEEGNNIGEEKQIRKMIDMRKRGPKNSVILRSAQRCNQNEFSKALNYENIDNRFSFMH